MASFYPAAADVGLTVLRNGGNAFDAFIAAVLVEWVVAPGVTTFAGNFSAILLDAEDRRVLHLDGEYNSVSDPAGSFAAGDPAGKTVLPFGSIAALAALHERNGSVAWAELVEPAIAIAEEGFVIDSYYAALIAYRRSILERSEHGRGTYFRDGAPLAAGDRLRLPEVAGFLRALRDEGADYVYRGAWAERCVEEVRTHGGLITEADLAGYEAVWRAPREVPYRDHRVLGASGRYFGSALALLGLGWLERDGAVLSARETPSADDLETLVRLTFRLYDQGWLFDGHELDMHDAVARRLEDLRGTGRAPRRAPRVSTHSSSLGVVDELGNVIVATHSINALPWSEGIFCEGVPLGGGGQWATHIAPGERRLTPLTQHIVVDEEGVFRSATSTWNAGLVQAELQLLVHLIDYGMDAHAAGDRPRFGGRVADATGAWTEQSYLDPRVPAAVVAELVRRGLDFEQEGYIDTGSGTVIAADASRVITAESTSGPTELTGAVAIVEPAD
jgi:gamma-glutamyltranspeptidase/glutathione hydrolase